jgi:hypothetical protein
VPAILTQLEPELIEIAMRNLIESPAFRSSKQCQTLLKYIVEKSLAQQDDLLRERVIGAEVFGRAPDYDTGNDPIVRARVGEIRKRLAQYYQENRDNTTVTISVPSGSYKAIFAQDELPRPLAIKETLNPEAQEPSLARTPDLLQETLSGTSLQVSDPETARRRSKLPRMLLVSLLAIVLCVIGIVGFRHRQEEQNRQLAQRFWNPISDGSKPPLIYIGSNYFYRLSNDYLSRYRKAHGIEDTIPSSPIVLSSTDNIPAKDLTWTHSYTGYGDVAATARIVAALTKLGSKYDLRYGDDISISDLHSSPAILLGGYSNLWSIQLTHGFRYTLGHEGKIVDRDDRGKTWQVEPQNDYAIISRFKAKTGGYVVSIAGVGAAANQAAADFVSDPDQLGKALHQAPKGWPDKNMQMVLHTALLNRVPISVDIQALYFW